MSADAPLSPRTAVVSRLRAAGCVFAEEEADLLLAAAPTPSALAAMVDRRVAGLPLEQVLGWAEFCGLRILVEPGVFVPRRRTEFLVRKAVALVEDRPGPLVVVDMCCGSGAVGVALVAALGAVELYAADIDPVAVHCARRNLAACGGRVFAGDLYAALPRQLRGRVDLLVANAPYVPTEAIALMPPEAREYEPRMALDGGADGLAVLSRAITEAPHWLAPGGHLLVEASPLQARQLAEAAGRRGLSAWAVSCDELGATVLVATTPGAAGAGDFGLWGSGPTG